MNDVRIALRSLRRRPGFAAIALLTLALGTGVNTTIFSVLDRVVLRPLAFVQPERLVAVSSTVAGDAGLGLSVGDALELATTSTTFADVGWMEKPSLSDPVVLTDGARERIAGAWVSADFFRTLGVVPIMGRSFREGEDRRGGGRVALVSHGAWRSRWGADAAMVGRSVAVNGEAFTIVGVLPAELDIPVGGDAPELWLAKPYGAELLESRSPWLAMVVGRLREDSSIADAQRELDQLAAAARERFPDVHGATRFAATPLHAFWVGDVRGALLFLFACGVLVLMVACANLGIMVAARNASRGGELAVRQALGAARLRLAGSILAESMILGVFGTALGLVMSLGVEDGIAALSPVDLPRLGGPWLDARLVLFSAAVAVASAVVVGVAPVARALRTPPAAVLRTRGTALPGTLARALIAAECATVSALLLAAAHAGRGFLAVLSIDPGFAAENRLIADLTVPPELTWREDDGADRSRAFFADVRQRLGAIPGIESAGFVTNLPLTPASWSGEFRRRGETALRAPTVDWEMAGTGYFETAGIEVLEGRAFTNADHRQAPLVVVVNETLARRYFPQGDAIGSVITGESADGPWRAIIGVVADVKQRSLGQPEASPQMYIHDEQGWAWDERRLVVRTRGDPMAYVDAVRAAVHEADRNVAVDGFRPMSTLIEESAASPRFHALLLMVFATTSTVLGLAGVFGVVSDSVQQRHTEIALRMALGARRRTVLLAELRRGLQPVAVGALAGVALAVAAFRVATGLVTGLEAVQPSIALTVAGALLLVAAIATLGPAHRAASVAPADALKGM